MTIALGSLFPEQIKPLSLLIGAAAFPVAAFRDRGEIKPAELAPVVYGQDRLQMHPARWGLIPQWWHKAEPPERTTDARFEDIRTSLMFKQSYQQGRAVVPASYAAIWRTAHDDDGNVILKPDGKPLNRRVHRARMDCQPLMIACVVQKVRFQDSWVLTTALVSKAPPPSQVSDGRVPYLATDLKAWLNHGALDLEQPEWTTLTPAREVKKAA